MNNPPSNPDSTDVLYTLVLRPLKSDVPPIIRLRRALKALLRSYGLRCVDHRMTPTLSHATPPANNGTPEDGSCSSVGTVGIVDAFSHAVDAKDCASGIFSCKPAMQSVKMGKGTCQPPSALG